MVVGGGGKDCAAVHCRCCGAAVLLRCRQISYDIPNRAAESCQANIWNGMGQLGRGRMRVLMRVAIVSHVVAGGGGGGAAEAAAATVTAADVGRA
jgi:hypothetical protein